ncbi:MAG TPA: ABC transporter permease [Stellaceae bacterium]|jgi:NitT/TauT family transport system permease protein|nr:ABC transporter permease [Stellaceae bacterium]
MSQRAIVWLSRLIIVAVLLVAWQIAIEHSRIAAFFLGSPAVIADKLLDWIWSGVIFRHLGITLLETLLSFVIGCGLALILGLLLALSDTLAAIFDPFIKGLNSMPRLIMAPIFAVWFGLGIWSKVALGVTLVFFVVFFNVFQGIREVSPVLLANARMLGASQYQLIRRVYIPSALSWVFSSLHLSVGLAFVGAVIGEYLGSSAGVGYLILEAEGTFDIETVIAGVILLTACALILDYLISIVEASLLKWQAK